MELSYAPMEGVTYSLYRTMHSHKFPGVYNYYAPFIAPDSTGNYKAGSLRDVLPENNNGIRLIPQILANNPDAFLSLAKELADMGYREINLNAGCPSGCVFNKYKGSGMLRDLDSLKRFLDRVFTVCPLSISVKTRMGVHDTAEFPDILNIYNMYPFSKLIVHARPRDGMYQSEPDWEAFLSVISSTHLPVLYNGNIFTPDDYRRIVSGAPWIKGVLIGRGAVCNPALFRVILGGKQLTKDELWDFHNCYLEQTLSSGLFEHYTVGRMKELWYYMKWNFQSPEKAIKRINKAKHLNEYSPAVNQLFTDCVFDPSNGFSR